MHAESDYSKVYSQTYELQTNWIMYMIYVRVNTTELGLDIVMNWWYNPEGFY